MNIYLDPKEDTKLDRLKNRFNKKSKEDVIKALIKQFPENQDELDTLNTSFDMDKETKI